MRGQHDPELGRGLPGRLRAALVSLRRRLGIHRNNLREVAEGGSGRTLVILWEIGKLHVEWHRDTDSALWGAWVTLGSRGVCGWIHLGGRAIALAWNWRGSYG